VWQAVERLAAELAHHRHLDDAEIVRATGYNVRLANEARRMHAMIEAAAMMPVPPRPPYRHKRRKARDHSFQLCGR